MFHVNVDVYAMSKQWCDMIWCSYVMLWYYMTVMMLKVYVYCNIVCSKPHSSFRRFHDFLWIQAVINRVEIVGRVCLCPCQLSRSRHHSQCTSYCTEFTRVIIEISGGAKRGPAGAMAPPCQRHGPSSTPSLFIGNVYVPECQWLAEATSQYYDWHVNVFSMTCLIQLFTLDISIFKNINYWYNYCNSSMQFQCNELIYIFWHIYLANSYRIINGA